MTSFLLLLGFALVGLIAWKLLAGKNSQPVAQESLPKLENIADNSPAEMNELLVVLTATASVALGQHVVVRRITFLNQNTVSGWAEAGRTSLHWSHNVRRNN